MGRCLAQQLAAMGASLAISDADEKGLAETARLLGSPRGKVTQHIVDVADEARVKAFGEEFCSEMNRKPVRFDDAAMKLLQQLPFTGNIRELRNVVERIVILAFLVQAIVGYALLHYAQ